MRPLGGTRPAVFTADDLARRICDSVFLSRLGLEDDRNETTDSVWRCAWQSASWMRKIAYRVGAIGDANRLPVGEICRCPSAESAIRSYASGLCRPAVREGCRASSWVFFVMAPHHPKPGRVRARSRTSLRRA